MLVEPPEKGTQDPSRKWNLDRYANCLAALCIFAPIVTAGVEPIFLRTFHESR
jgi:hypothetical protein